ncbi:GntR family transcriptional regulator [Arthrobacter sp. AQ5-05]|uniref:GntR family transcriptional regulator n=1 Tax=Arthrobacter sp. AQ5-05 TaxID=2184581 RepID=UPI000DCCFD4E|nr:GntR family transcriptional regulator [Arthrobacter sp. AQ5-05]RAX46568.1 GntR family transcriptional regulator [Arthrobacter sp. AQ5-05]
MTTSTAAAALELPAAETVQASLRQKITEGFLLPGSRLLDQPLAEEYGVSRNTVRDALRLLTTDGLVVSVRNAGSSVRILSVADIHDIYTARRLIETGAVAQSSTASDELLSELDRAASLSERYVGAGDWNKVGTSSLAFHQCIVKLVRSERVDGFFNNLAAQLRLAFAVMPDESAFQVSWVGRDRDIADLILSGRRDEATTQLIDYLNESEAQIIDGVRAATRARLKPENPERTS